MATARRLAKEQGDGRTSRSRTHILIAGPGRAGTTVLVRLLDALGFETEAGQLKFHEHARAGLESSVLSPDAPHVVKSPELSVELATLIESGKLEPKQVDWLVVPLRSLEDAAASRVQASIDQRKVRNAPGGLVGTMRPAKQQGWLAEATYRLFEAAALYEIPLIVLQYPQFVSDPEHAFRRLAPLLEDRDYPGFVSAWRSVIDPGLIHDGPMRMPRLATLRTVPWRLRTIIGLKCLGGRRRVAGLLSTR